MCNTFCKEFRRWGRSFTKTEVLLAILELILLILLIALIVFLVLHLIACAKEHEKDSSFIRTTARAHKHRATKSLTMKIHSMSANIKTTPSIVCTWKPSNKTLASDHYYENDQKTTPMTPQTTKEDIGPNLTTDKSDEIHNTHTGQPVTFDDDAWYSDDDADGDEPEEMYKSFILALVKLGPPGDGTFGCILSAVSERWALTAASCVEAVEEVDSLDSFVMVERYGAGAGAAHEVADVRVHPQRDAAALRAAGRLLRGARPPRLPAPLDLLAVTLGERLALLGFGPFRSRDAAGPGRGRGRGLGLRQAAVHALPAGRCARGGDGAGAGEGRWAPRHLWAGRAEGRGACGAGAGARPLCAGVLRARAGPPCGYCAGAPLLRGRTLLALQAAAAAAAGPCGAACEPQLYTNLAAIRDWIQYVIQT